MDALDQALADLQAEAEERRRAPPPSAPPASPAEGARDAPPPQQARPENLSPFDRLRILAPILGRTALRSAQDFASSPSSVALAPQMLGAQVVNAARPVARGAIRAVNETTDLAAEVGTLAADAITGGPDASLEERQRRLAFLDPRRDTFGGSVGRGIINFGNAMESVGWQPIRNEAPNIPGGETPEGASLGERAVEGVSQTIVGYLMGGRLLKAAGVGPGITTAGRFARAGAQGEIGDFIAFDGNDARLSNLIEAVPQLRNPVTQFLSADADDDELTGRLKNTLEGLGVGGLFEGFLQVLRGTRALAKGDRAGVEAASAELERQVTSGATSRRAAVEAVAASTARQAQAAAQAPASRIAQIIDGLRSRLGLGPRPTTAASFDAAQELAAVKREAGDKAASEVDVAGLTPSEAANRQRSARVSAEAVAETEFTKQQRAAETQQQAPGAEGARAEGSSQDGRAKQRGPNADSEIPEGVLSSRQDVQALVDEIAFNRNFSGELNIKPDSEPRLAQTHGEWTLNTFGTPEKLDATLRALVERTAPKTTRSDVDLHSAALRAEAELGQAPADVLAVGAHIAGIVGDIDIAVDTMRVLWKRTSAEVDSFVGRNSAAATPDEFANMVRAIHNALTFSNYMAQVKSAMGRGLRVFKLPDADTYARLIEAGDPTDSLRSPTRSLPPLPRDREEVSDWLELWGLTRDNPKARTALVEGMQALPDQWKYLRNSAANLFTANILSGLPSVMLNVVGPATIGAVRTIEKTTGAGMLALNPFITRAQRATHLRTARNASVAYVQAFADIGAVFKYAAQSVRDGRSILGGGGSVSDRANQFGPITEGMMRAAGQPTGALNNVGYWAGNVLNMWPSAFSRLNNGLDEFAKRMSFLGEVRARALVEGGDRNLTGDELAQFVAEKVRSSTDDVGAAVDDNMLRAAERTTFTGTPGGEGSKARALSNLINDWRANTPEIRYVLPIFNVPANALGETLTRVPIVNYALRDTREALLGHRGAVEQAEAHGRMLLGAGMLTAGFYLARSGQLTGAGPSNPTDRKVWSMTHQPYSIRIGDQWVDYSRYDILGSLLGIPATVFDATVNRRQDLSWFETMAAGAGAMAQFFRERAALQTVADLLSFGEPGQSAEAFFERFTGGTLGRLAVPNFVTQLGRHAAGDDSARTKTQWFQYMLDLMPFASASLDPQRNVWGEPIHRPKDSFFENVAPITLTPASVYENDPQTDELDRLYAATGYAAGVTAQDDISAGFYDAREIELEDGRSLYDAIIRARLSVEIDGMTLRQAAQELFDSADYADAVDADASNRETSNGDTSRGYLISQVFREYNTAAKQEVARQSDTAARFLAATAAKRTDDALLRATSAEDLVGVRGLAEAMGVDLDRYIERARGE